VHDAKGRRKAFGIILVALIITFTASPGFRNFVTIPDHVRLSRGEVQELDFSLPLSVYVRSDKEGMLALNGLAVGTQGARIALGSPIAFEPLELGKVNLEFRLFGIVPIRRMTVDVVPRFQMVVGGHSIGVLLKSEGVMVVSHGSVKAPDGKAYQPAKEAGIEVGDTILRINGEAVTSEDHVTQLVEKAARNGSGVTIEIKRRGHLLSKPVIPVKDRESGRYRIGLYVRDGAVGVGTLTFYDPVSKKYGALGHIITDSDTSRPISVSEGHLVEANINAIEPGYPGEPGEKIASFPDEDQWIGNIEKNTSFGIFGTLNQPVGNRWYPEPIPVAMSSQVKEGPAEIVTVVIGLNLEKFTIQIVRVIQQPSADGKGLIIKVTDPRLLDRTRGIVQGMSGSPIIQDGKLVGAVTHVFVNDPTRGYGILAEWMMQEAGILNSPKATQTSGVIPWGLDFAFDG
jgi:stage IV sporulation protein B